MLETEEARLEVAPRLGGSIVCYRAQNFDWLRPASREAALIDKADGMSCFPLVPYSNRIRDGVFTFRGRKITLSSDLPHALHGHGWRSAWTVEEQSAEMLTIAYRHAADDWPFEYLARQIFELDRDRLTVTIELLNEGRDPMPCGLGLHPYFPLTPDVVVSARVRAMWQSDANVLPVRLQTPPPSGLDPSPGLRLSEVVLDTVFAGWSREATIEWPAIGRRLTMTASAPLDFLVIYSPPGADYFCLEPVSNCTDAFNLAAAGRVDTGGLVLKAGDAARATVTIDPA